LKTIGPAGIGLRDGRAVPMSWSKETARAEAFNNFVASLMDEAVERDFVGVPFPVPLYNRRKGDRHLSWDTLHGSSMAPFQTADSSILHRATNGSNGQGMFDKVFNEEGRVGKFQIRFPASCVAQVVGLVRFQRKGIFDLLFQFVYQGAQMKRVLAQDSEILGTKVISDKEKENRQIETLPQDLGSKIRAIKSKPPCDMHAAAKHNTKISELLNSAKRRKRKRTIALERKMHSMADQVDSVETEIQRLKKRLRDNELPTEAVEQLCRLEKSVETKRLVIGRLESTISSEKAKVRQVEDLKDSLRGNLRKHVGATKEDGCCDAYELHTGRTVFSKNEHIKEMGFCRLDGHYRVFDDYKDVIQRSRVKDLLCPKTSAYFMITGRIDGRCKDDQGQDIILEIKNRTAKSKVQAEPPLYDVVQLVTYMYVYGVARGDMVQCYVGKEKKISITNYCLDSNEQLLCRFFENCILPRLYMFAQVIYRLRGDTIQRLRFLQAYHSRKDSSIAVEMSAEILSLCPFLIGEYDEHKPPQ